MESERKFQLGITFYGGGNQFSPVNPDPEEWVDLSLRQNGTDLILDLHCNPASPALCISN